MASKLLNVLQNIEQGRQGIITAFNSRGENLSNDTDFETIADHVATLPRSEKFIGPEPIIDPADEIDIYQRPTWLQPIIARFRETQDITVDGLEYLPRAMVIFKVTHATNIFYMKTQTGAAIDERENSILLGHHENYPSQYNFIRIIEGSDGQRLIVDGNTNDTVEEEYVWDSTKDIVVDGEHYRYFFLYIPDLKAGYSSSYCNYTHLKVCEFVTNYLNFVSGENAFPNFDCATITSPHTPLSRAKHTTQTYLTLQAPMAKSFILDIHDDIQIISKTASISTGSYTWRTTLLDTARRGIWSRYNTGNNMPSFIYLNIGAVIGFGSRVSGGGTTHIKWLYVDPEIQASQAITTLYLPSLIDSNLQDCITSINASNDSYRSFTLGSNLRKVEFSNLTNCATNARLCDRYCYEFSAPKLVSVSNIGCLTNIPCTVLDLPKLETLPSTLSYSQDTTRLLLPSLKDASKVDFWLNGQTRLEYIDISGFENDSGTITISSYDSVEWVVVPENFKCSITCQSNSLELECVLDIINKMGTLPEGITKTLTLSASVRAKIPEEYLAIATNKGWTVTS